MIRNAILLSLCTLFLLTGCSSEPSTNEEPLEILFAAYGVDSLVEVITWNVEYAQSATFSTYKEQKVAEIIQSFDADIIAVQEFPSQLQMDRIIEKLDGFSGIVNSDADNYYQNTAYFFKNETVTLQNSGPIYTDDSYLFPRSPFTADFLVENDFGAFEVHTVNIHLKAFGDSTSNARRKAANDSLESYVRQYQTADDQKNVIVLGDYNDTIDDSLVFRAWYHYPEEYLFSTKDICNDPFQASYPSWPSFIDHLLLTASLNGINGPYMHTETQTIRLDDHINEYANISDHRPVMSKFKLIKEK